MTARHGAQSWASGHGAQEDQPHGGAARHEHQGAVLAAGPGAGEGDPELHLITSNILLVLQGRIVAERERREVEQRRAESERLAR